MSRKNWVLAFVFILLSLSQPKNSNASSLNGSTGLVNIPTAEMPKDREIFCGLSWLDKKYLPFDVKQRNAIVAYFRFGFLPFLEITPSLTRHTTTLPIRRLGLGDRSVTIRLRLLSEEFIFPAVVLGLRDPFGSGYSSDSYLVTSKSFHSNSIDIVVHLGYGFDWFSGENQNLFGLFGGILLSPEQSIALIFEYDSEKLNWGIRTFIFERVEILLAFLDFDTFSGGIGYKFRI